LAQQPGIPKEGALIDATGSVGAETTAKKTFVHLRNGRVVKAELTVLEPRTDRYAKTLLLAV
jgi:hypothetical protein